MADETYINIWRKCRSNPLFCEKPYDRWHAFEYLIINARFTATDFIMPGTNKMVHLEPGQLFRSMSTLAKDWGWSAKKVRNFVKLLENQKMVSTEGLPKGTLITIENYTKYQIEGRAEVSAKVTSKGNQRAIKGRHKNKVNKENKDKECIKNIYSDIPAELLEPLTAYVDMRKAIKKPMTDRSMTMFMNKVSKLSGGDMDTATRLIDEATLHNWLSVYPINEKKPVEDIDWSKI